METEEESLTLAQIESNHRLVSIEHSIDGVSNYASCKQAIQTMLELSEEELAKIEERLRCKILKNGENFMQKFDTLRADAEKTKIEYEQHFSEMESGYVETQTKFEAELKKSLLFQAKANENDEKVVQLAKQNKLLTDDKETLLSNQQRLNTVNQNLEVEKRELHSRLDRLIGENDRLNQDWKTMNLKLSDAESKALEMTAKYEEAQARESTVSFREKQFQMDKQRLMNEIQYLNEELQKKSNQLLQNRSESSSKIYDFEAKVDELTADNKKSKSLLENLQTANQDMEAQVEDLTQKLQDVREKYATNKIDFEEETQSREKVMELYKEQYNKSREEIDEAATAIVDLQKIVSDLKSEYSKLADEKKMNETAYEAKFKENSEAIAKLEQELKNANELLSIAKRKGANVLSESDIQQMSPAAAVASRLLKSGMSLTQIYSEYVNLSEELQNEKQENQRLKTYVNEIVNDIEAKAPILKRQRQEHEEDKQTIGTLTTQLENAMMDYEVLKSKSEDSIKKYNAVASENVRLRQDVSDLSRQVTVLLQEVEKLRSKLLSKSGADSFKEQDMNRSDIMESSMAEVSSSSETLSKDLLLFRNCEELQKQNQKLVRLIHEITDKKQSEEKIELEARTKEYHEKLSMAFNQIEEFRNQREKHEQVLDEIRKQRDTYKQLLNTQHTAKKDQPENNMLMSFVTSTPGTQRMPVQTLGSNLNCENSFADITNKKVQEQTDQLESTSAALSKLQKQFEAYQQQMMSTNKMLNEDIDKYRSENSGLNMKLALAESKLESSLEKCKTLNTAIDKTRRELEAVKERNSKFNDIVIKHEQSLNLTTQENNKLSEKLNEYENRVHTLTFECDMHKSNHERLVKERDLLLQENSSKSTIMSSLEMIKNSFTRNERETQAMFKQKIEQLERDNQIQQRQLEQNQEKHDVLVKSWKSQYDQLVDQRDKENAEYDKLKASYEDTKTQYDSLKEKHTEVEAKLHSQELIVQISRNTKSSTAISRLTHLEEESKELQMKLSLADKEIVSLKIQLEESRAHGKQYKTIGDTMEQAMKEQSEANENAKRVLEGKIAELEENLSKLNAEYNEVVSARDTLEASLASERQANEAAVQVAMEEKKKLVDELDLVKKTLENTEQILAERTNNRDEYMAKLAILEEQLNEAQEKLTATEATLNETQTKEGDINRTAQSVSEQLEHERRSKEELIASHAQNQELMNQNLGQLKTENESLNSQINVLQTELSKMGQDLLILQKQDSIKSRSDASFNMSTSEAMNTSLSGATNAESSSNLLEINRYLRTQKDQTEEKYETLKLTADINEQRLRTIENDLDFYKRQSQAYEADIAHLQGSIEKFKSQATFNATTEGSAATQSQSSQDNFNLIMDTNKRLKEEIDALTGENTKVKAEVIALEEEMSELRAKLSEASIKSVSLKGENNCMTVEVKRWKDRVDALLNSSDNGAEWNKIKAEMQAAEEKSQELTDMINELRKNLAEVTGKREQVSRDFEAFRIQAQADKTKATQDLENLKLDKNKREEMFKGLVAGLREVVSLVLKEMGLKDIDWANMKGPMNEKLNFIKTELTKAKQAISEKVKKDREELLGKVKALADKAEEISVASKKAEEAENKLKEKEIRFAQMANLININKTRFASQKKTIEDLTKEVTDLKAASQSQASATTGQVAQLQSKAPESADAVPTVPKAEMDAIKSRYLQSKFEIERLKKELENTNASLVEAKGTTPASSSTTASVTPAPQAAQATAAPTGVAQTNQQQPPKTIVTTTSALAAPNTSNPNSSDGSQQTSTPTAYIAPSLNRVTKVNPQQQQQQQPANTSGLAIRRTAAVQPTPHDAGNISSNRQQVVTPISINQQPEANQWSAMQQQASSSQSTAPSETNSSQPDTSSQTASELVVVTGTSQQTFASQETTTSSTPATSQASTASSTTIVINKRIREDDQDDFLTMGSTVTNTGKKQRSSSENTQSFEQPTGAATTSSNAQAVATIEPYSSSQNTDDQRSPVNQEIIIEDEISPTTGSGSHESDYVSIDGGGQQNVLSSTSGQMNEQNLEDYDNSPRDEEEDDVILDEEDETIEQDNGDQDEGDDDDLHLEIGEDTNENSNNQMDNGDNQNDDEIQDEDLNSGEAYTQDTEPDTNNSASPDSSAQQQQDQQQQQSQQQAQQPAQQTIQSAVVSSESATASTGAGQQASTTTSSTTIRLNPSASSFTASAVSTTSNQGSSLFRSFGSNQHQQQQEPRREVPKPIVWNAPSNSNQPQQQQQQQQQTGQMFQQQQGNSSNFRINRRQVPQQGQQQPFQQGQQLQQNNQGGFNQQMQQQQGNTPNYFQQEMQMQQQQQQQHQLQQNQMIQMNQFRMQNNPNQFSQVNTGSGMQQQMGGQQINPDSQVINLANPMMAQQRAMNRGGQRGGRGGANPMRRGGGSNPGRGGRGGLNQNFQG